MATASPWTRKQTLAALHIYFQLPFGQLHQRNPLITQLASWMGRTPSAVALKLVNFASLDPQVRASGRLGMGHASRLDEAVWGELNAHWDDVAAEAALYFEEYGQSQGMAPGSEVLDDVPELAEGRMTMATIQVRVNQARFRRSILASYNARCCISGLAEPRLLVASHIVPWSLDTQNRLNPHNGLCLSALHDKAYDLGLITVLPNFMVRVSRQLQGVDVDSFTRESIARYDGHRITLPDRFRPDPAFLESHARRFQLL
ncbi:MAG: HNH endonuclease [Giesbergeria sp.]|jgi:predicted restriction endonuclease|nr:HNH endonuclease [Giesbergeria sp.]